VFSGEEVFLFGLYRLGNAGKFSRRDIREHFGFQHESTCSECFSLFVDFMTDTWGYLLTNNESLKLTEHRETSAFTDNETLTL
jgi:hypothetical protein